MYEDENLGHATEYDLLGSDDASNNVFGIPLNPTYDVTPTPFTL